MSNSSNEPSSSSSSIRSRAVSLPDVVDLVGEVAEIAPALIVLRIPIVGQFEQRRLVRDAGIFVIRRGQEDQREAALLALRAAHLFHAELVAIEVERLVDVGHADHRVKIAHWGSLVRFDRSIDCPLVVSQPN
jgi:hypothetical protein